MGLTRMGRVLKAARMIRVYKDGDGTGFVWRWWNPLTWAVFPVLFIFAVVMQGLPETLKDKHYIGVGMKPWFLQHPERLEWLP